MAADRIPLDVAVILEQEQLDMLLALSLSQPNSAQVSSNCVSGAFEAAIFYSMHKSSRTVNLPCWRLLIWNPSHPHPHFSGMFFFLIHQIYGKGWF